MVVAELSDGRHRGHGECVPYARYDETVRGVIEALGKIGQRLAFGLDRTALQSEMPPGAARNALALSNARYQAGYSPYLEVLDAQRTANDAELAFVRNRQARLAFSVDLMKALGGGWKFGDGARTP